MPIDQVIVEAEYDAATPVNIDDQMPQAGRETDKSISIAEEMKENPRTDSMIKSDSIDIEREYEAARQVVGHDVEDDEISDDSDYADDIEAMPEKLQGHDPSMAFNVSGIHKDKEEVYSDSFVNNNEQVSDDDEEYSEVGEDLPKAPPQNIMTFDHDKSSSGDDYSDVEDQVPSPPSNKPKAGNMQQKKEDSDYSDGFD